LLDGLGGGTRSGADVRIAPGVRCGPGLRGLGMRGFTACGCGEGELAGLPELDHVFQAAE